MRPFLLVLGLAVLGLTGMGQARAETQAPDPCRHHTGPDWMECHFRLGMKAKAERRWRAAIREFRLMLAQDPGLQRVRLELAESYFLAGNDEQAERHFRYALGNPLPPGVVKRVMAYLDAIKRRKRWSFTFDFSITPQSNVNSATDRKVIVVGGIPWTLTEDSRRKAGLRLDAAADFVWRPVLGEDLRGHVRLAPRFVATTDGQSPKTLTDMRWSRSALYLNSELGLVYLRDRQEYSAGLALGRYWAWGEGYRKHIGGWARGIWEVSDVLSLAASLEVLRLIYDTDIERKGWEVSPGLTIRRQLSPVMAVTLAPTFTWHGVKAKDRSYIMPGTSLGLDIILPRDFTLQLTGSVAYSRYLADDDVFGKRRRDWTLRGAARLTWARFTAWDLAPYVEVFHERRSSTIVLHEYDNTGVVVGLTKTF